MLGSEDKAKAGHREGGRGAAHPKAQQPLRNLGRKRKKTAHTQLTA